MPAITSPSADPLEGYVDEIGLDRECDWCCRAATMITPEGWPICGTCADEREDVRFNFQCRE